jgi:CHAT domain-containing protein
MMENYKLSFKHFFVRSLFSAYVIVSLLACAEKQMSVEEAKQVAVEMSGEAFVAPPRRIDDIFETLNRPEQFDQKLVEKIKATADASPPKNADANFFMRRSDAAISLGRARQAMDDLRTAFRYAGGKKSKNIQILNRLAALESINGNFNRAIEFAKQSLKVKESLYVYDNFVELHTLTGDFESAKTFLNQGLRLCNRNRSKGVGGRWPDFFEASMQARFLDRQGKHKDAEPFIHTALKNIKFQKDFINILVVWRSILAENLVNQGRLYEAEIEARQALKIALGSSGRGSGLTVRSLLALGEVLISQGRLNEAHKLCLVLISIVEESGIPADSLKMGLARMLLGKVSASMYDFAEAAKQFDIAKQDLLNNQYLFQKLFGRNPNLILALIKTGRTDEALQLISAVYDIYRKNFGDNNYLTAEALGLRGMAYVNKQSFKQAADDFSKSIPKLLAANIASEDNYSKRRRFQLIVEDYIGFLAQIHDSQLDKELEIQAADEAFKLADAIRGQVVQSAVGASGARVAVENPVLADLVRREQDSYHQINALQSILTDNLAAPEDQRDPAAIESLSTNLDTLRKARQTLLEEIKKQFPLYSDFTNPQPTTISAVKQYLKPNETLILIHTSENHSYVWAVPYNGKMKFYKSMLGKKRVTQIVSHLRHILAPDPQTLGDIPGFDFQQAYELYNNLLKPLEVAWKDATDLIIVAHEPLGQLPFGILPTSLIGSSKTENVLFENYRTVPWLIRSVSITRQPSVSSFVTLRNLPKGDPGRKAFAGFGDPFFNQQQLAQAEEEKSVQQASATGLDKTFQVRGIRITDIGNLDSKQITTSHLDMLNRLPDTAEEIKSIAKALGADPTTDIFLGQRASEGRVKAMDLSDRRVLAFATHALVPNDLDGLNQPALALCSPEITGENEDGLLTLGEILKLKLNADWVVLSACNTGAAAGAGAEAVSGLGRAFFYAGTRAILVSMWPVETTSARKLTTGLFRYQQEDQTLSRARALQKSSLALIDGPGLKDHASGKIAASYAHPFFWAPFIIVGEGGSNAN